MKNQKVLKIPADWKHPKKHPQDQGGGYEPLLDSSYEPDLEHAYMPEWPEAKRTHYQMYYVYGRLWVAESPVMETPEALADWLLKIPDYAYLGYAKVLSFIKESSQTPTK